jgi:hypothetical protein
VAGAQLRAALFRRLYIHDAGDNSPPQSREAISVAAIDRRATASPDEFPMPRILKDDFSGLIDLWEHGRCPKMLRYRIAPLIRSMLRLSLCGRIA